MVALEHGRIRDLLRPYHVRGRLWSLLAHGRHVADDDYRRDIAFPSFQNKPSKKQNPFEIFGFIFDYSDRSIHHAIRSKFGR